MQQILKHSFLLVAFALFFSACSEDEPTIDVREQAVGTYQATLTITFSNGSFLTETTEMEVTKDGTNGLLFTIDGESESLIGVREANNGIGFNFPNTTEMDEEGDAYTISGTQSISLDSDNYDGRFSTASKEFELEVKNEYVNTDYSAYNYTLKIRAFKQ
jgi:hypothetical protein